MKTFGKLIIGLIAAMFVVFSAEAQKKETPVETVVYSVNIHCESCKNKIEKNIPFEKGVKDLSVDMKTNEVSVTFDPSKTSKDKLAESLKKLKFEVKEVAKK